MNKINFFLIIAIMNMFSCGQQAGEKKSFKSNRFVEIDYYHLNGLKPVDYENRNKYPQFEIINLNKNKVKVVEYHSSKFFDETTFQKGRHFWFAIENDIEDAEYEGKILRILEKNRTLVFLYRPLIDRRIQLNSFYQTGNDKKTEIGFENLILDSISESNYPNSDSLINSNQIRFKSIANFSVINDKILKYEETHLKTKDIYVETIKKCYELEKVYYSSNNRMGIIFCNDCNVNCE